MPRYVYGSICVRMEKFLDLNVMYCNWIYALKVFGLSLDLLGQLAMTRFERLSSMCDHSTNFCSLSICGWMCRMLSVSIARSFPYIVVVHVVGEVLKRHPMLSCSNHLSSSSRNIMNWFGLRVSPCMVS